MIWLRLLYLLLAMFICSIGAGIGVARRVFSEPKLVLGTSAGISGIFLYLAAGGIYITGVSWNWSFAITAICVIALTAEWRELRRWWRDPSARQVLIGWLLVELWILLVNLNIRHFSLWEGDWAEHYERAIFFLQHQPLWSKFIGDYLLPARPPMMNLIESLFMAQSGSGYGDYQIVSGFLNGTLYLAVAGLAIEWSGRRIGLFVAALLAINPWFMQNATYPWTKLYSEFFVILGIWLYGRRFRVPAIVMFAAGCLVHYSVAVVPIYIALYDVIFNYRQWRQIFVSWMLSGLLLATWVTWAVTNYGRAFANSTTTLTEAQKHSWTDSVRIYAWNALHSVIPSGFEPSVISETLHSSSHFWVKICDVLFLAYEPGIILSWGIGGLIAVIWCLAHARFARGKFWIGLVLFTYFGGLLLHTPAAYYYGGVAHVVLQPIVWLGIAWIASRVAEMPRWLVWSWSCGALVDAAWLMLHFIIESRWIEFAPQATGYAPIDAAAGAHMTIYNAFIQFTHNLQFLGMETVVFDGLFLTAMICAAVGWWISVRQSLCRLRK